jgi:CBS domain-containing protein
MMRQYNIRHLPVQDAGKLVGIVTHRDVQFALGWEGKAEKELQVKDVYTPEPFIISPNAKLTDALVRMEKDQLGCALVVEKGKLAGIFTTTDACRVLAEFLVR